MLDKKNKVSFGIYLIVGQFFGILEEFFKLFKMVIILIQKYVQKLKLFIFILGCSIGNIQGVENIKFVWVFFLRFFFLVGRDKFVEERLVCKIENYQLEQIF